MKRDNVKIILASASPRRRELLEGFGWNIQIIVPEIDETQLPSENPKDFCLRLALTKAAKAAEMVRDEEAIIIAADTVVVINGEVLGKPADERENILMLERLEGRTHEVMTALCVRGKEVLARVERTEVFFRPMSKEAIAAYAATGEGADKAGGYAIQGKGSILTVHIKGDYFTVVGLPMCTLGVMLEELGLTLPEQLSI